MAVTPGSRVLARRQHPEPAAVAEALAYAFLASDEWSTRALVDSGAAVLGARRRWLRELVEEVVSAFARRPSDAPRQLSALIATSTTFLDAAARAERTGRPLRAHHLSVTPTVFRQGSAPVAPADTLADLARMLDLTIGDLHWFADTAHWNRRAEPGPLHHYRYEWRARPGRVPRLLEIPGRRMRQVQRALLELVVGLVPAHDAAHGFIPGRSAASGAVEHIGAPIVITADLTTFFATVTATRIYGTLRQAGYPENVAHTLTGLCTNAVPMRVLAAMPSGGSPDERFALRQALAHAHLPQGAPTSPMLANLAVRRLDSRLTGWARASAPDAAYTRYADDLTFSGGTPLAQRPDAFLQGVRRIVEDEGYRLNPAKTRVRRQGSRQTVTSIVVNERLNASRGEVDRLKAIIHNCVVQGPESQNRGAVPEFRAHLLGRISWVESLNPGRGAQLRREFARIAW